MSLRHNNYTENIVDLTFHRLAPFSDFSGARTKTHITWDWYTLSQIGQHRCVERNAHYIVVPISRYLKIGRFSQARSQMVKFKV